MNEHSHWSNIEERGFYWGMRFMLGVYSLLGKRICVVLIYPIVFYYWLVNHDGRRASLQFLKHVTPKSPDTGVDATLWWSYLHFVEFAKSMINKLAAWKGDVGYHNVVFHNHGQFVDLLSHRQGAVLLGSHLGNLEISKALSELRSDVHLNILVYTKHAENFNRLINEVSDQSTIELIQVTDLNPGTAILLQEKITNGELVVVAGDRTPISSQRRTIDVEFLGKFAPFPQGPFILAALLKCPVYTIFCLEKGEKHHIYFEHFSDGLILPREGRLESMQVHAKRYADRLGRYAMEEPLQWFNFFDFWHQIKN